MKSVKRFLNNVLTHCFVGSSNNNNTGEFENIWFHLLLLLLLCSNCNKWIDANHPHYLPTVADALANDEMTAVARATAMEVVARVKGTIWRLELVVGIEAMAMVVLEEVITLPAKRNLKVAIDFLCFTCLPNWPLDVWWQDQREVERSRSSWTGQANLFTFRWPATHSNSVYPDWALLYSSSSLSLLPSKESDKRAKCCNKIDWLLCALRAQT